MMASALSWPGWPIRPAWKRSSAYDDMSAADIRLLISAICALTTEYSGVAILISRFARLLLDREGRG